MHTAGRRPSETLDVATRRTHLHDSAKFSGGTIASLIDAQRSRAIRVAEGLWRRDAGVWSNDPKVRQAIANRLGWMVAPPSMLPALERVRAFADRVRQDGFTDVVLLGMGGSSLAPEVLRAIVGVQAGWPSLHVLDSTDPAAVLAAHTPPATTLYLLASKSGTTIEPNSLAAYFQQRLLREGVSSWQSHFVAITDEGTALAHRARTEGFRDVFINPSDIGGRFSAVSLFGLVPSALMGQDVAAMVDWAAAMLEVAAPGSGDVSTNPAVGLGLLMGAAARAGRDKLTLQMSPALSAFGLWVEQLVAESTGKNGVGIVPVSGEPPAIADSGRDRVVVRLCAGWLGEKPAAPVNGDAPTATFVVPELAALGAEFVRWEIATAVAGALLDVNPFDEPNVQQAKDATRVLLAEHRANGRLPMPEPDRSHEGVALSLSVAARHRLGADPPDQFLKTAGSGDYVTVLAYLGPSAETDAVLNDFRSAVAVRTGLATSVGKGPRYLHSTGQLHKGGANTGVFVLVTATPAQDLEVPGEAFSFGTLELAQALGDFSSLDGTGRRALHVHLPAPDAGLLRRSLDRLLTALARR
ncbi:MAG: glucose-6-phosphate isomerase [Vicinamibacterales bacterium]